MAIGIALPYGGYYVVDKFFNIKYFDVTVHTGVATKLITYHTYAGSDLGLNIAAEQSLFNHRLVSRVQLTSFFDGSNATMQNVSGGIGYRPRFKNNKLLFLEDLEISYSLSFLSLPVNIGIHLVVITKYF
jgi:hypothetical protein